MTIDQLLTRGVAEVLPSKATLEKLISTKKIRLYIGIDPTGNELHLGHAVALRKLNQFAQAGHHVILLIGNGTVRIGDPTGKDTTRPMLTDEVIQKNFENWKAQASKVLDFSNIEIRYNGDWLDKLTYADIVKLMAQTTVQQLIERDMFQKRIKKGLPIFGHEIMYPLLQGYDSVAMDVDLEIGGTDQTFNMMMGRHLQKVYNNHEKWVLTTKIINGTDGRKMSKSYNNYVPLTDDPQNMFGKLMSITDDLITEYFTLLTDTPTEEIVEMSTAMQSGENPMNFKKKLAHLITTDLHDEVTARAAQEHFEKTVQGSEVPEEMTLISIKDTAVALLDLVCKARPELSKNDVRRLIQQGAVEIDGEKKMQFDEMITIKQYMIVRSGKRNFAKVH